jgi:hypothetical protein
MIPAERSSSVQIKIRLPRRVMQLSDRFGDWLNITLWQRGRIDLRIVDIFIAVGGVACVGWYAWTEGWWGVLKGTLGYIFMCMIGFWFL